MNAVVDKVECRHETIRIRGTVQGVGFRPTVWRLAREIGVRGHTLNDGDGVLVHAWGSEDQLETLVRRIRAEAPTLAHIRTVERTVQDAGAAPDAFSIIRSTQGASRTDVAADAATCPDCVAETLDPFSRRYRYPFTNCTNCGPRLSIIHAIPYDRAATSMAPFELCADCAREYDDPADRRFHAQPVACHACGPRARLVRTDGHVVCTETLTQLDDVDAAGNLILNGEVVAIKGLGGYHLACDARSEAAVDRLRARKRRYHKPFALMAANVGIIERYCQVSAAERELLESPAAPIVVLAVRDDGEGAGSLASGLAPGQNTLGFMLPYTPLHHLLLKRIDRPVVMTSGNLSDEPQCTDDADALARLAPICDFALIHDRTIENRVDDSVVRVVGGEARLLRRARGYAPSPLALPPGFPADRALLALGGDLKNTFCVVDGERAVVSQHIGDLHDATTLEDYQRSLALYEGLFEHRPQRLVLDHHPEYMSTKVGLERAERDGIEVLSVQHHHAHIASCMGDNGWPLHGGPVLGVAMDGLGLGADGELWGGEFLLADYTAYERLGSMKSVALLGNAQAMREPWRNTYAHLVAQMGWNAFRLNFSQLELYRFLEGKPRAALDAMLASETNVPAASSCGRLFDAVAAALGVCREAASYEGQAAVELEALVDPHCLAHEGDELAYPFTLPRRQHDGLPYLEPLAMWNALLGDLILDTPRPIMAARFHKGLARAIAHAVRVLATRDDERYVHHVALSGGVFQNKVLLEEVTRRLDQQSFTVLTHKRIPANDGGLSFGQALVGLAQHHEE